jgi:hypothetical protein
MQYAGVKQSLSIDSATEEEILHSEQWVRGCDISLRVYETR